jgi:3-methyladenine DNA glycosylase AlkD
MMRCKKEHNMQDIQKLLWENQLHGFLISGMKDFGECVRELERFLPYIDNWATCDQTSPKVFKKHREELLFYIDKWIQSNHTYTVRFATALCCMLYIIFLR